MFSEKFGEESAQEKGENRLEHMFQGQEAEVNIIIEGDKVDGGWLVEGEDLTKEAGTHVAVIKGNEIKSVSVVELESWQPFKVGETVPVLRTPKESGGEKWLDSGWEITSAPGYGLFRVEKDINGERNHKNVKKTDLVKAQIAKIEAERDAVLDGGRATRVNADSMKDINENLKFWEEKLKVTKLAEKKHLKELQKSEKMRAAEKPADDEEEDVIVGQTPE